MPSLSKEAALVHEALVARGLETPLRPPVHEMDNETRQKPYCWSYDRNHAAAESRPG
ncbi:GTP cyclohydrolase I FolE [Escherichia coli]|uniref:GTP cyclohydrolase I FolE n=1 Tax=Escherichia coli TaxID=562 RepID=A0A377CC90_ECOLX|nr:GTP cyclohydrolase I FolE [Escherichia coli]